MTDCSLCSGTGYIVEYIGPGHNPVPLGDVPCPDCADARGRELDRVYACQCELPCFAGLDGTGCFNTAADLTAQFSDDEILAVLESA